MEIAKERRRHYLVNRRIQLQFAHLLVLMAVIPIILLGSSLYIVNKTYLYAMQRIIGEGVLSDIDIKSVLDFSAQSLAALVIITTVLFVYIGIRFSHHVAGPVNKLEETMDALAKGGDAELLHFRKTDAVTELAEKFNIIINMIKQRKQ